MDSTVRTRPTHYETLGLKPTATSEEIAQAFAREISIFRPRPFGGVAEVSVAYETLRDPARRRAYDEAMGLNQPPPAAKIAAQFIGAAFARPVTKLELPPLAPKPDPLIAPPAPPPQPAVEPKPASFIAASLREVAAPRPLHDVTPAVRPDPPRVPEAAAEPKLAPEVPTAVHDHFHNVEDGSIDWKRTGVAVAGMIGAVSLIGAWAGWESSNDAEQATTQAPAKRAVTMPLPPAKELAAMAEDAERGETARPARLARLTLTPPRSARRPATPQPNAAEQQQPYYTADTAAGPPPLNPPEPAFAHVAAAEAPSSEAPAAQAAATEAPPPVVRASMPLSNRTIAQTIHRIGYSCGSVASTSAIAPGTFRVTCTSGQSYRASPVRGRYRFSKMGRN